MNNYNGYVTGCSSGRGKAVTSEVCTYKYDNLTLQEEGQGYAGAGASTTGNITGIYDTNGGAWEYVLGVYNKVTGLSSSSNSGYSGLLSNKVEYQEREWPDEKYYDIYTTNNRDTACNGTSCKGRAISETVTWYNDYFYMLNNGEPWITRGGQALDSWGSTGLFAFGPISGLSSTYDTFRLVLTPNL